MKKYLVQYNVDSELISCNEPLAFSVNDVLFTLYLHEKDIFTKGFKLQAVCQSESEVEAQKKVADAVIDFQERLIYYTGEKIFINRFEFILPSQKGMPERRIRVRITDLKGEQHLDAGYFSYLQEFLDIKLEKNEKLSIHHIALAMIENVNTSKFRSLYLAIEDLVDRDLVEVKCDSCGKPLRCPDGHGSKKYEVTKKTQIAEFLSSDEFPFPDLFEVDINELTKFRGKLFHSTREKGGFLNEELNSLINNVSLKLQSFFQSKHKLKFPGGSVINYKAAYELRILYKSANEDLEFDFNIPSLVDIQKGNNREVWRPE